MAKPKKVEEVIVEVKRKGYSDEQKAEIKRRRDERNAAVKALLDAIATNKEGILTDEMKELAKIATPKTSAGTGAKSTSIMSSIIAVFDDVTEVDEITIFQTLHLGRQEMATAIKNIIKKAKPEDRVWIAFYPEEGVYAVKGRGADVPEDWTGYVPVEEVLEEATDEGNNETEEVLEEATDEGNNETEEDLPVY